MPICIIPARGGSKRIPRKNIARFNGKPLIAWSIETALASDLFSNVVVSTDDAEIADISREFGAETPFMRDAFIADDHATTADVILDALDRLPVSQTACCLYPTAPMVIAKDLKDAHQTLVTNEADSVISVTEYDFHPLRAFEKTTDKRLQFNWPEHANSRSQDLPELIHDAGAFYFFDVKAFREQKTLVMNNTMPFPIPRNRAVDIDTPEDFEFAKHLHRYLQASK